MGQKEVRSLIYFRRAILLWGGFQIYGKRTLYLNLVLEHLFMLFASGYKLARCTGVLITKEEG